MHFDFLSSPTQHSRPESQLSKQIVIVPIIVIRLLERSQLLIEKIARRDLDGIHQPFGPCVHSHPIFLNDLVHPGDFSLHSLFVLLVLL